MLGVEKASFRSSSPSWDIFRLIISVSITQLSVIILCLNLSYSV